MTSMTLTLVAASLNDQPLSQPITAVFDSRGGTIGRADHNTMTLPDPQRHVSRLQAEVLLHGRHYMLRNVGAANPIQVGARTLAHGENATITGEEDIRIGGYLLRASLGTAPVPQPTPTLTPPLVPRAPSPAPASALVPAAVVGIAPPVPGAIPAGSSGAADAAFADLLGPAGATSGLNPFADLLGTPPAARPEALESRPAVVVPASGAVQRSNDPFADLLGTAAPTPTPAPVFAPAPTSATTPGRTPGPTPAAAAFAPPPLATRSSDPFADLLGPPAAATPAAWAAAPSPSVDPFADLMPPPAGVHARSAALAPPPPVAPRLPDDFDPFALPSAASAAPSRASAPSVDPFADLMPSGDASGSIDSLFGLGAAAARGPLASDDPLSGFMAASPALPAGAPGAGLSGAATDPLALFGPGTGAATAQPVQPAQPDQVSALHAAWQPPRVQAPVVAPANPSAPVAPWPAVGAQAAPAGDAAALWAAFCQGAGISVDVPPQDVAARLYDVGRVLRSAVDGSLQLIAVRASTKHELRAGVTVIQQRDNNPLKFSPDARLALEQLLQPPLRGFLDGPAAMDDAMHDLVGHTIGSVAGLRAAVEGMLERFAPQALESKLAAGSLLDSLLPMNRKARLWDLYLQHSQAIREEAQEDFHTLFGKAFVAAYEQQIERLKRDPGGRR